MSNLKFDLPKDKPSIIKVIGVGGGGSNAVNHMYRMGIKGVDFIVCNTDHQALEASPVPVKIQLGPNLTEGRGAGSLPEKGRDAALENIDELTEILSTNTKMVFITAGMGGGTGTGAAPVIAEAANKMGILTVGIVTAPFGFEGRKRKEQAASGIEEMKKNVDALLVISNDKVRDIYGNLKIFEAFSKADNILLVAAKAIAGIINESFYINVDFADVETVMRKSGVAILGSGTGEGKDRALNAVQTALDSPLLNDNDINGARYILLSISAGSDEPTMDEIGEINDYIQAKAGHTADIIMATGIEPDLGEKLCVTVVATGFNTDLIEPAPVKPEKIVHVLGSKESMNTEDIQAPKIEAKTEEERLPNPEIKLQTNLEPTLFIQKTEHNDSSTQAPVQNHESAQVDNVDDDMVFNPAIHQAVQQHPIKSNPDFEIEFTSSNEESTEQKQEQKEAKEFPRKDEFDRSRERINELRRLSLRSNTPGGINDLEKEPAFRRKNIKLDNVPSSSDSNVSRYTLTINENEDDKPRFKSNNPYLHDRVD